MLDIYLTFFEISQKNEDSESRWSYEQWIMNLIIDNFDYLIIWRIDDDLTAESFFFRYHDYNVENCVMTTSMTRIITQNRLNVDEDFADTLTTFIINVIKNKQIDPRMQTFSAIGIDININEIMYIFSKLWSYLFLHVCTDTEWFTTTEIDRVIEINHLCYLNENTFYYDVHVSSTSRSNLTLRSDAICDTCRKHRFAHDDVYVSVMIIYVSSERNVITIFLRVTWTRIITCVKSWLRYCYDSRLRNDVVTTSYDEHSK